MWIGSKYIISLLNARKPCLPTILPNQKVRGSCSGQFGRHFLIWKPHLHFNLSTPAVCQHQVALSPLRCTETLSFFSHSWLLYPIFQHEEVCGSCPQADVSVCTSVSDISHPARPRPIRHLLEFGSFSPHHVRPLIFICQTGVLIYHCTFFL